MSDFISVKGFVENIGELRIISEKFRTQDLTIKTSENYPQLITVSFHNDKTDLLNGIEKNSAVTAYINLRGRSFTRKDGSVSYVNTLECWKLDGSRVESPKSSNKPPQAVAPSNSEDDDLPF